MRQLRLFLNGFILYNTNCRRLLVSGFLRKFGGILYYMDWSPRYFEGTIH